ncbi:MAG TPA: cellulase family glycosylhydrolase [Tepidisphaeraceae bacterium]|nr:cellulase family glycosylhydrolase [Tepidisphaeraceae bacterium]
MLQAQPAPSTQPWWQGGGGGFRRPTTNPDATKLPLISVKGNHFVDPQGNVVLFRGLSISDPDKIDGQGHWNKEHFEHIKEMGATIVRIPVHPAAWRGRGPENYMKLLDQAVQWCTDLGIYVDIDWHSIGNLKMELFQNPMYETSQKETYDFWRTIARHFNGNNTVAFYELFNEQTTFRGTLGNITWHDWKEINENMIKLIRATDKEKIELVAGFDWAYDLTPLREEPIAAEGIGYVTHPYANKRPRPWEPKWEEDFGFAASNYPIIATEIGFGVRNGETINDDHYGNLITRYLEGRGISWVAWVYDPQWGPQMLKSWDYDLTGSGEFFKEAMHREVAKPK